MDESTQSPAELVPTGASSEDLMHAYEVLRARLVELKSAPERDVVEIDRVVDRLAETELAMKASRGLIGNNPSDA